MTAKKGVYVSYSSIGTIVAFGFLFFFALRIGQWWEQATFFDHVLLSGSIIGLGTFGLLFWMPIMSILTKSSARKEQIQKLIEQQSTNQYQNKAAIQQERVALSDDPYGDDGGSVSIVRRET